MNTVGTGSFLLNPFYSEWVVDQYYSEHRSMESVFHFLNLQITLKALGDDVQVMSVRDLWVQ